jgi:hypothetical protein
MADIRLLSALSKEFPLELLEEEVEAVDVAEESSVKRLEVLCRLEIDIEGDPFLVEFSEIRPLRERISELPAMTAI